MTRRTPAPALTTTTRAFTLTELMVAVVVLIGVIVATSKIFGTASAVAGKSKAGTDVMVELAAVEAQIREDFQRVTHEGFFMIRCVQVRNDINLASGGGLLNSRLKPQDTLRCDQLIFFANGVQSSHVYMQGEFANRKPVGGLARVYYGHAFQVPGAPPADDMGSQVLAVDVDLTAPNTLTNDPMVPWDIGTRNTVKTLFVRDGSPNDYTTQSGVGQISIRQPPATQWILARHPVLLVDDGDFPDGDSTYLFQMRTAFSIADPVVLNGRVDAAKSQLDDIRRFVLFNGNTPRTWPEAREVIASSAFYPRAERVAPSRNRVDQALTSNVLANGCSSFTVDWTYADGVGRQIDRFGDLVPNGDGMVITGNVEQPWFGLDDDTVTQNRGVHSLQKWITASPFTDHGDPIVSTAIEGAIPTAYANAIENSLPNNPPTNAVVVYEAIFGFNQDTPFDADGNVDIDTGYTPWPTAIRITMKLHDAGGRLERGREVQFVIDLPKRSK